ncbi:ABC transporter [Sporanaerobium hydrogeniformans]|uniref:ABC transporter n=1 Tax=Sporanaerobium hydrogeniformans TaxID=3072179 RepID=A0AC61DEC3_9FIRM|nr:metal ABC transporter permease [Sporanaerobium hydrogeniformans]PHV71418.1 ABC transporter [Sporanaerobium hydrogeniformans]
MMEKIYALMDILLPFEWAQYTFMKNALLGILLVSPLFGMLGTMVVNNKMAFFSDALGHSALTGIAIGVLLGFKQPLWSMMAFSLLLTLGIVKVKNAKTASMDTIIGVFSAMAVALGIVILSYRGGFSKYTVYLIGDLLSITPTDLGLLTLAFIGVLLFWMLGFNQLFLVSLNPSLAKSRGLSLAVWEYLFTLLVAVIVTLSIQWVGTLIISSLLILPAAASRNIAHNTKQYVGFSIGLAFVAGLSGLLLSYFIESASGATIVLVLGIFFCITYMLKIKSTQEGA